MFVAGVLGTGSALPEKIITNADLEKLVETSDQWITERTGIRERRQAPPEMAVSDMALRAATLALERAGLTAGPGLTGKVSGGGVRARPITCASSLCTSNLENEESPGMVND